MAARKLLCSVIAVLLCFAAAGCSSPQPAAELPLMIMAEDAVYQHGAGTLDASVPIEDGQILGQGSGAQRRGQLPRRPGRALRPLPPGGIPGRPRGVFCPPVAHLPPLGGLTRHNRGPPA